MPVKRRKRTVSSGEDEEQITEAEQQARRLQKLHEATEAKKRKKREQGARRIVTQRSRENSMERNIRREVDERRHVLERQRETSGEREIRRQDDVDRHSTERARENSMERNIRRQVDERRHVLERQRETSGEREIRRQDDVDRHSTERARENSMERNIRREVDERRHVLERQRETSGEREIRRQDDVDRHSTERARENSMERNIRREVDERRHVLERQRETSGEREIRRQDDVNRHSTERARETSQDRFTRRRRDADWHRGIHPQPGWLSSENGLNIEKHNLGPLNRVCEYCGALHFAASKTNCCKNGKIYHEPSRNLPPAIEELLLAKGKKFEEFRSKIVVYNNLTAMASINYSHVDVPGGIPVTKVQGLVMHNRSDVFPNRGKTPRYGQMYAYFDVNMSETKRREYTVENSMDMDIDIEIVHMIQEELLPQNPLVMQYQCIGQMCREFQTEHPEEDLPRKYMFVKDAYKDIKGYMIEDRYKSRYEKIRADQAAFLYETDREGRPKGPGFWVNLKIGRKNPKPLPHYHPLIDPLCYVLIEFYGHTGYDYRSDDMKYQEPRKRFGDLIGAETPAQTVVEQESENDEPENIAEQNFVQDLAENLVQRFDSISNDEDESNAHEVENRTVSTRRARRRVIVSESDEDIPLEPSHANENELDAGPSTLVVHSDSENDEVQTRQTHANRGGSSKRSCIINSSDEEEISSDVEDEEELPEEMRAVFRTMLRTTMPGREIQHESTDDEDSGSESESEHPESDSEYEEAEPSTSQERPPVLSRKKQSMAEYFNFKMQLRQSDINRRYHSIFSTKKLGQLYSCDAYMRIVEQRHDFSRKKRVEKRITTEDQLEQALIAENDEREERLRQSRQFIYRNRRAQERGCELGAQIFSTPEVTGSARYYRKKMEDAMAIVHEYGKPDLFVTFTGNPKWEEIEKNLLPNQNWTDAPMLVVEVFRAKMVEFLKDVIDNEGFGKVAAFAWSVEFQKRGMPHIHLLITLEEGWKLDTTEKIDKFIYARLPEIPEEATPEQREQLEELQKIVLKHQIHTPCAGRPTAYCRKTSKYPHGRYCGKHFPHDFNDFTKLGEKGYAEPWRPKGITAEQENGNTVDNSWVVAYSPLLSMKYMTHINVEVCSNVLACKYIYKYVYKGTDKVLIEFVDGLAVDCGTEQGAVPKLKQIGRNVVLPKVVHPNATQIAGLQEKAARILTELKIPKKMHGRPVVLYDELAIEEQLACITAPEAAYGIADNPRTRLSHSVTSLAVHMEQKKDIIWDAKTKTTIVANSVRSGDYVSQLEAWFELNKTDPSARNLTYKEAATHYILKKNGHKWKFQKKRQQRIDKALVRVRPVNPKFLETYAIRELAMNTQGATSFDDLRKVTSEIDGQETSFPTFAEAAKARRLMNGEKEWKDTMSEAVLIETPRNIRRIFASILIFGSPTKDLPINLWNEFAEQMYDRSGDYSRMRAEHFEACALFHIEKILRYHNMELSDFGLPNVDQTALMSDSISNEIRAEMFDDIGVTFTQAASQVEQKKMYKDLNWDQRKAYKEIVTSIMEQKSEKMFAVLGSGGTGKTYLYKAIYHKLNAEGKKVQMCAHTGIAAQLLIDGSTIHRYFWIESTEEGELQSRIQAGTRKAEELRSLDCLVWDEVSMSDRNLMTAVDNVLRYATGKNLPFGGKAIVVGGDYKQLLPVIPEISGPDIMEETALNHPLWPSFKKLTLKKNVRAKEDVNFAAMLEEIGHGLHTKDGRYPVCLSCFPIFVENENDVIEWTFGNGKIENLSEIKGTCILTTLNEESTKINNKLLAILPGERKTFISIDTPDENTGLQMPPEYFHKEMDSNMPPHELHLKIGCIVILLKNLDVRRGLCNGTRLVVTRMQDNYIACKFLDRHAEEETLITRMRLRPSLKTGKPMYTRTQLPLRLAYSITIHKAQGQTLDKVMIYLRNPVFSHGHLYTGMSRVRRSQDLRIFTSDEKGPTDQEHQKENEKHESVILLKNIVFDNVLRKLES